LHSMLKLHTLTWLFSLLLLNYESTSYPLSNDAKDDELLASNTTFPSIQSVLDFIYVGALLQVNDSCEKIQSKDTFPDGAECMYFKESDVTTRAIIVTSQKSKLIAVVFADFNNLEDIIFDPSVVQVPFGPAGDPILDNVKVRSGYNDLLFYYGLFFDLLDKVKEYHQENPDWGIYTSGHGLGGGLSLLMAAGISNYIPDVSITNIGTGTAVVGDKGWANYMNNNANINVWRYVCNQDIVPRVRLSESYFHVGHTVQLNRIDVRAFYQHYGDSSLGYAGVPPSWNLRGLINPANGFLYHVVAEYISYIELVSKTGPDIYWADEFEKCTKTNPCSDDNDEATFYDEATF